MISSVSDFFYRDRFYLLVFVAASVLGIASGFVFYGGQISSAPVWQWMVIMDCPVALALFAGVCFFYFYGKDPPVVLVLLASVYMIKYGIWTTLATALYWSYIPAAGQAFNMMNVAGHLLAVAGGVLLVPRIIRIRAVHAVPVLAWLILNDVSDYLFGTVTSIPGNHMGLLFSYSLLSSAGITLFIFFHKKTTA